MSSFLHMMQIEYMPIQEFQGSIWFWEENLLLFKPLPSDTKNTSTLLFYRDILLCGIDKVVGKINSLEQENIKTW